MWIKSIALAATLGIASLDPATAQNFEPDPANRGYPAYAQPGFSGYYNGLPKGAAAPAFDSQRSRPAALRKRR
jgi:hypothetical protein